MNRRARLIVSACAITISIAPPCLGQNPTKQGVAQTLFDEARTLFDRGAFDAACDKFKASHELDPKGGTLLNLALCREKQGRIASAWTAFAEARNLSSKEGRGERVSFAETKLRELEKSVPRVVVSVSDATRVQGLSIRIDGESLPAPAWNTGVPIDPGAHRLEAVAPGHVSHSAPFSIAVGVTASVAVPPLARAELPATNGAASATPAPVPSSPSRWPGWTALGVGAAAIGVGAVFGVRAFDSRAEAEALCKAGRCAEGEDINDDGVRSAWISNIAIGLGALSVVAGVYVLVRGGSSGARVADARALSLSF